MKQERIKKNTTRTSMVFTQIMFLVFFMLFSFHAVPASAFNVDLYDNFGYGSNPSTVSIGDTYDGISWANGTCMNTNLGQYQMFGILNSPYEAYAYCIQTNYDTNNTYDLCFIKNNTYFDESLLKELTFPAAAYVLSETSSQWGEAEYAYNNGIYVPYPMSCNNEVGNTYLKTSRGLKTSLVKYYGITNPDTREKIWQGSTGLIEITGTTWAAARFYSSNDILRRIGLYINTGVTPNADVTISVRASLTGSDLVSKTIPNTTFTSGSGEYIIDIPDVKINSSTDYYIIVRCPSCSGSKPLRWHYENYTTSGFDMIRYNSSTSGSSWNTITSAHMSYSLYGDDGLRDLGTASPQNYYFIDQMKTVCPVDGASEYDVVGRYDTSGFVDIGAVSCSVGKHCDATITATTSSNMKVLPTTICRTIDGFSCTSSADCWHDRSCSGATTTYNGYCNGDLVDIDTNAYTDGCGGIGLLDSSSTDSNNNCTTDGGFPSKYVCDPEYDLVEFTTIGDVYNNICKGSFGATCSDTSDCYTGFECLGGVCAATVYTVYTYNISEPALYKNELVTFDPILSSASYGTIQYACWRYNNTPISCYGNSTQCATYCPSASVNGSVWNLTFSKKFYDTGTYNVNLTLGSQGLYQSSYSESFCVSGDSTYCWTCLDNILNDDETYVDWGGHCGSPYYLKCTNGVLDNITQEVEIDWGGLCGNCSNGTIKAEDDDYLFLQAGGLISGYPFNTTQCKEAAEVQGGVVFFVVLLSAILVIPTLLLIGVLIFGIFIALINLGTAALGGVFYDKIKKLFKRNKK